MPGAKRRALKKLLSPSHSPARDESSPISQRLSEGTPSLAYEAPTPGINDEGMIKEMEARGGMIGTPQSTEHLAASPTYIPKGETNNLAISPQSTLSLSPTSSVSRLPSPVAIPQQGVSESNHGIPPPSSPTKSPNKRFSIPSFGFSSHSNHTDKHKSHSGSSTETAPSPRKSFENFRRSFDGSSRPTPEELMGVSPSPTVPDQEHPGNHHHHHHHHGGKKSSKQRFAEREARKKQALLDGAPVVSEEETKRMEREKWEEEEVMRKAEKELNGYLVEIEPDGHCMYSAIADQLHLLGLSNTKSYQNARHSAATYLRGHAADFQAFLPSVLGEDMAGATDDGVMTDEGYQEYCKRVEHSGDWGGEIEIQALSKYYNIPIHVIQRGPPMILAHSPDETGKSGPITSEESLACGKAVRISYHRRMYGLGEHYNSMHPRDEADLPMDKLVLSHRDHQIQEARM